MDKPSLRRQLRTLSRERLTESLRHQGSASIIAQLRAHPLWQASQHIGLYSALPDEPNLRPLIDEVAGTKHLSLPRVLDDETQTLEQSGSFGIYEPRLEEGAVHPRTLDLLIIPALAYDQAGYRLGRGKGYYDRYLQRANCAHRLGVTFALHPIEQLPHDPWDIPVEDVLTPHPFLL